jgi:hypothetical protein
MPLSSIGSYLITADAYIQHWTEVNTALGGGGPLVLPGGYDLADFQAERDAADDAIDLVTTKQNDYQIAAGDREAAKLALMERGKQLRLAVQAIVRKDGFVSALPTVPKQGVNPSLFIKGFVALANVWSDVNAASGVPDFTPPLTIGSYTLANFNTQIEAMKNLFEATTAAEQSASTARKLRNDKLAALKKKMQQYGKIVPVRFGTAHPYTLSVPVLSAPPGSTPDPVQVSGAWNAGTSKADFSWTPCQHAALDHYQVRGCTSLPYRAADEFVIATVPKTQTTFSTDQGLMLPGAKVTVKVYACTDTGNEKGSNAVTITRPA